MLTNIKKIPDPYDRLHNHQHLLLFIWLGMGSITTLKIWSLRRVTPLNGHKLGNFSFEKAKNGIFDQTGLNGPKRT